MAHEPCTHCGSTQGPDHACPAPFLGRILDNRYQIESLLGQGGMGMVFQATQTSMKRQVAIKTLNPSLAVAPQFFERFRREAEVASRLKHPNVVTVFDFGRDPDGTCYFVMEHLEGESLRQLVRRDGALTLRRAVDITEQVARGLAHAHEQGVVHRDMKPHNLMVSQVDGRDFVKVLDFGLVKAMEGDGEEQLTSTGQVLGTPQYMPPEQAGGEEVDERSDLYSLAGVFYFCLTGSSPYGANSVRKALTAALTQPVPSVASRRQGAPVPREVDEFLRKALAKEKEDRHQSAQVLIDDLLDAIAGCTAAQLDALPETSTGSGLRDGSGADSRRRTPTSQSSRSRPPRASAPNVIVDPALTVSRSGNRPTAPDLPSLKTGNTNPGEGGTVGGTGTVDLRGGPAWLRPVLGASVAALLLVAGAAAVVTLQRQRPAVQAVKAVPERAAQVRVRLRSSPDGAEVYQGPSMLGTTPLELRLSRSDVHSLVFKLEGHTPAGRSLDLAPLAEDSLDVHVELAPVAAPRQEQPKPPRRRASDEIPVFD